MRTTPFNHLAFEATPPLQNGHYIEVVCPLDHSVLDGSRFGKAVAPLAAVSGGCQMGRFS